MNDDKFMNDDIYWTLITLSLFLHYLWYLVLLPFSVQLLVTLCSAFLAQVLLMLVSPTNLTSYQSAVLQAYLEVVLQHCYLKQDLDPKDPKNNHIFYVNNKKLIQQSYINWSGQYCWRTNNSLQVQKSIFVQMSLRQIEL